MKSVIILFIVLLGWCGSGQQYHPPKVMGDTMIFEKEEWVISPENQSNNRIMFSDTSDAAIDSQGNIYLLDRNYSEIKKFSPKGKFIKGIGRKGCGPGEFMLLSNLICAHDGQEEVIVTYDIQRRCLQSFNMDLEFKPSLKQQSSFFGSFCGNNKILLGNLFGVNETLFAMNWQDGSSREEKLTDSSFLEPINQYKSGPFFRVYFCKVYSCNQESQQFVAAYLSMSGEFPLFFLDSDGRFQRKITVAYDNYYEFPQSFMVHPGDIFGKRLVYIDSIHYMSDSKTLIHVVDTTNHTDGLKQTDSLLTIDNADGTIISRQSMKAGLRLLKHVNRKDGVYFIYKDFEDESAHFAKLKTSISR